MASRKTTFPGPGAAWLLVPAVLISAWPALATFSIVAVDTVTRAVGSVGASCIDTTMSGLRNLGIDRISELVPGRGAINGQQNWAQANLAVARQKMAAGDSPAQILGLLMQSQYNPQNYQYLIIDLSNGRPRDTAFTGANGTAFKGHLIGRDYALGGNLLLGSHVLDSMRNAFVRSAGRPLPERLMAGILGAKFPGADGRCLDRGVSSLSAYIRVATPTDSNHLRIAIRSVRPGTEPLDSLKKRFDAWRAPVSLPADPSREGALARTVDGNGMLLSFAGGLPDRIELLDLSGKTANVLYRPVDAGTARIRLPSGGLYFLRWYRQGRMAGSQKIASLRGSAPRPSPR